MAITPAPGQIVASDTWDALFTQHGGMSNDTQATRVARTPEQIKAAALAGDEDPAAQQRRIYRYVLIDGSYVDARTSADGQGWEIVDYTPSPAFTATQKPTAAATQKPTGGSRTIEGTPDPAAPGGFNNEQPRWVTRDASGTEIWSEPVTGGDLDDWRDARARSRNPGGKSDKEIADDAAKAEADRKAAAQQTIVGTNTTEPFIVIADAAGNLTSKPNPNYKGDIPKPGTNIQVKGGDGKTYIVPIDAQGNVGQPRDLGIPAETPKPTIIKGTGGRPDMQAIDDPDNPGQVKYVPIQGAGGGGVTLPEGIARPQFSPAQVATGLRDLRTKMDAAVKAGQMTAADAAQVMTEEYQAAEVYLTEQKQQQELAANVFGTQVSQRGQDVSMVNQRTSAAAGIANQAFGTLVPMLRYAQAGSGDPAAALQEWMGMARGNVEAMGGLVNVPGIGIPEPIRGSAGLPVPGGAPVPGAAYPSVPSGGAQGNVSPAPLAPRTAQPLAPAPTAAGSAPMVVNIGTGAQPTVTPPQPTAPDPNRFDMTPQGPVPRVMTPSSATNAPQDLPPLAVRQALYAQLEPLMAADPSWGIDDIGLIQQGVGPLG